MSGLVVCVVILLCSLLNVQADLAIPLRIDYATGDSLDGDTRYANGDDGNEIFNLGRDVPFGEKGVNLRKLYVSPNGVISIDDFQGTGATNNWNNKPNMIYAFFRDVVLEDTSCSTEKLGCGMYVRKPLSSDVTAIKRLITSANLRQYVSAESDPDKRPYGGIDMFTPDTERTVIVTWYRVISFAGSNAAVNSMEHNKRNTFQLILTSDGTQSFAILSYDRLDWPEDGVDFKAGVVFEDNKWCQLDVDRSGPRPSSNKEELLCQSNAYKKGVLVVGLTPQSAPTCGSLRTGSPAGSEKRVEASCANCGPQDVSTWQDMNGRSNNVETCNLNHPVCGSDDVTYQSMCELRSQACANFDGLLYVYDNKTCYRSPCLFDNGGCEDICEVDPLNKYKAKCSCSDGKRVKRDGKSCNYDEFNYIGSVNEFHIGKGFNNYSRVYVNGTILSMADDPDNNTIFYVTKWNHEASIVVAYRPRKNITESYRYVGWLTGTVTKIVFIPGEDRIIGGSREGHLTEITNVYAETPTSRYLRSFDSVSDIVVEPCSRKIFLADHRAGKIYLFNETSKVDTVVEGIERVNALAIDLVKHKLYWYDEINGIKEANYDGSCQRTVVQDMQGNTPVSMVFNSNKLFWLNGNYRFDRGGYSVMRFNLHNAGGRSANASMLVEATMPQAIKGFGFILNSPADSCPVTYTCSDPCGIGNGGCEDVCVSNENENGKRVPECHCRGGRRLKEDGKSCSYRGTFFVGMKDRVMMSKSFGDDHTQIKFNDVHGNVTAATFDDSTNTFIFAYQDLGNYGIAMRGIGDSKTTLLRRRQSSEVVGMFYDSFNSSLIVAERSGSLKIIHDMSNPQVSELARYSGILAIESDPCSSDIFVLVIDQYNSGSIQRYSKGKENQVIHHRIHSPKAMTIDIKNHNLYWSSGMGIHESKFDGSCTRLITRNMWALSNLVSMAYGQNSLYLVDGQSKMNGFAPSGQYILNRMDIRNGTMRRIRESEERFSYIGFVPPESSDIKTLVDKEISIKKLPNLNKAFTVSKKMDKRYEKYEKEFMISFKFKTESMEDAPRTILQFGRMIDGTMPGFYYVNYGLMVMFPNGRNITVHNLVNVYTSVKMGRKREGQNYRSFLYVDDKLRYTYVNDKAEVRSMASFILHTNKNISQSLDGTIKELKFHREMLSPCPMSMKCNVHCSENHVCEEKCVKGEGGKPDRCQCFGGETPLKPDQASCDYSEYSLSAYDNTIMLNKGKHYLPIPTTGKVTALTHEFQTNLIFYANAENGTDGRMNHTIMSYHNKRQYRTIAVLGHHGPARHLNYHPGTQSLVFTVGNTVYAIENVHEDQHKKPVNLTTSPTGDEITGLVINLCPAERKMFFIGGNMLYEAIIVTEPDLNVTVERVASIDDASRLAIDVRNHKLIYSTNNNNKTFKEVNFDGDCTRKIADIEKGSPHTMHLYWDTLLWPNTDKIKLNLTKPKEYSWAMTDIDKGTTEYHAVEQRPASLSMIYNRKDFRNWYCPAKSKCEDNCTTRGCEDSCRMEVGRAKCFCQRGKLNDDGKTCNFTGYLLYAEGEYVKATHEHLPDFEENPGTDTVFALEYDYGKKRIFYSYVMSQMKGISMFKMGVGEREDYVGLLDTVKNVHSMSYDESNADLYFAYDDELHVIKKVYNNRSDELLYNMSSDMSKISGIAFEPCSRKVFITHGWNRPAQGFLSYWHNETGITTLLSDLKKPRALTIDRSVKRLYFFSGEKIMEVSYDGKCLRTVSAAKETGGVNWFMDSEVNPYALVVANDQNQMYWTDLQEVRGKELTMQEYNRFKNGSYGNSSLSTSYGLISTKLRCGCSFDYRSTNKMMYGVQIISDRTAKEASCEKKDVCSRCIHNNGGCYDRCIPGHGEFEARCHCRLGAVSSDGLSCNLTGYSVITFNGYVTFTNGIEGAEKDELTQPIDAVALGAEFDYEKLDSFYSTVEYENGKMVSKIMSLNLKREHREIFKSDERIERLAFDWKNKHMYYTTPDSLYVIRDIYTTMPRTAEKLSSFMSVTGLAFEPCESKVFVLCGGSNTLFAWDDEMMERKPVLEGLKNPKALGIDIVQRKLYFFEDDGIVQSSYDGNCRSTIKDLEPNHGMEPYSIYPGDGNLYFADTTKRNGVYHLMMFNLKSGMMTAHHKNARKMHTLISMWDRKMVSNEWYCKNVGNDCIEGGCRNNNGGCEDRCIALDRISKVRCECTHGILRPDMKGCEWSNYLVVGGVRNIHMLGKSLVTQNIGNTALAVEFNYQKNVIFYSMLNTNTMEGSIRSFNAKDVDEHILGGLPPIRSLTYDYQNNHLYFSADNRFGVIDMETSKSRVMEYDYRGRNEIVFEPCNREIFVSGWDGIRAWNIDSRTYRELPEIGQHFALTIDIVENKLYYFQKGVKITKLMQVNYDGSCRRSVADIKEEDILPYKSVYVSQERAVYWTNAKGNFVSKIYIDTGKIAEKIDFREKTHGLQMILDRPLFANCEALNKKDKDCPNYSQCKFRGCEEFCYEKHGMPQCGCRFGATLRKDGKTCDYSNNFYAASGRYVMMFNPKHTYVSKKAEVFAMAKYHVTAISHCPITKRVFFAYQYDGPSGKSIIEVRDMKGNQKHVMKGDYGEIHTISYDEAMDEIYFSTSKGMHKYMMKADFAFNLGIASKTTEIVLSDCSRDMIYLDMSMGFGKVMHILDAPQSTAKIISYGFQDITGLTLDREHNTLYWFDAQTGTIRESRAGFTCERSAADVGGDEIVSMQYMDGMIYYVVKNKKGVRDNMYVVDLRSGERSTSTMHVRPYIRRMKHFDLVEKMKHDGYQRGPDGMYYRYYGKQVTAEEAMKTCKAENASLVMYESQQVHEFLKREYGYFWIGATDKGEEGKWTWMGEKPIRRGYWKYGEPAGRHSADDCALMSDGEWRDAGCQSYKAPTVCQRKEMPRPATTRMPTQTGVKPSMPTGATMKPRNCDVDNGGCEDQCIPATDNMMSRCACNHGKLRMDGSTCDFTGYGIYASENFISLSSLEDEVILTIKGTALGTEFDFKKNVIFYSTHDKMKDESEIRGLDVKGKEHEFIEMDGRIERLAFDEATKDMFFTTRTGLYVVRNIYENKRFEMLNNSYSGINGLAFDPCTRSVFVMSNVSNSISVYDARTGRNQSVIARNLYHPRAFGFDMGQRSLYYISGDNKLYEMKVDGSCRKDIVQLNYDNDMEPFETVAGDGELFFADLKRRADGYYFRKVNLKTGQWSVVEKLQYVLHGIKFIWDRSLVTGNWYCTNFHATCKNYIDRWFCDSRGMNCHRKLVGSDLSTTRKPTPTRKPQTPKKFCNYWDFSCCSGECLQHDKKCNGVRDCADGSDEMFCYKETNSSKVCESYMFRCGNGECIDRAYKCDGINHCGDGTDERCCGPSSIPSTPKSAYGEPDKPAPTRITPVQPTPTGEGQRNCAKDNGGCEDRCIPGSDAFLTRCACNHGKLAADKAKCDFTGYGIYASENYVALTLGQDEIIHTFRGTALGVAFDFSQNRIFYSKQGVEYEFGRQVYSIMGFDSKQNSKQLFKGFDRIERLAFDYLQDDLFYTTPGGLYVIRKIYMNTESTLISSYMGASGLAFEPCKKMVYVLCTGSKGLYAHDAKTGKMTTILTGLRNPRALGIDLENQKLYFIEEHRVVETSYDGKCVRKVADLDPRNDWQPYEITVGDGNLHFADTKPRIDGYYFRSINIKTGAMTVGHKNKQILNSVKYIWDRRQAATSWYCENKAQVECKGDSGPNMMGYARGADGYHYKMHEAKVNWHKAKEVCESEGARLAVVDNNVTFAYIQHLLKGKENDNWIWLGGNDENGNNNWKWVNGKRIPLDPSHKLNFWGLGQPDNWDSRQEDCMATSRSTQGYFYDAGCTWEDPGFLCQKLMPTLPPKTTTTEAPKTRPRRMEGYIQAPNGNYYKYQSMAKNYTAAKQHCMKEGARLAVDKNMKVDVRITQAFPDTFWFEGFRSNVTRDNCTSMEDKRSQFSSCREEKPFLCEMKGTLGRCGSGMRCGSAILYPFGKAAGDSLVPKGDDKSGHLYFSKGFPFFSRRRKDIYINTNGHITADKPSNKWNDTDFDVPVVSAYMMDLSTEHGGRIHYRATHDRKVMERLAFEVSQHAPRPGQGDKIPKGYRPTRAIIATWEDVRMKADPSKRYTFQMVIHTNSSVVIDTSVYIRLDAHGGYPGAAEPECYNAFQKGWDRRTPIESSTTVGVKGVYVSRVDVPQCGIPMESQPMEMKWKMSKASMETSQSFYFNGRDRITQVFTQSVSWSFGSAAFVTNVTHTADEAKVNYVYFTNAVKDWNHGSVGVVIVRSNAKESNTLRRGSIYLKTSSQTRCYRQMFNESMNRSPRILLNVMMQQYDAPLDGLSTVWLRNVSMHGFDVCHKGMVSFWGPNSIFVDYLAITDEKEGIPESGVKKFARMGDKMKKKMQDEKRKEEQEPKKNMVDKRMDQPANKEGSIFCEDVPFKLNYNHVPLIVVTPEAEEENGNEGILAWVKNIKKRFVTICAKGVDDEVGYGRMSDMKVHYTVSAALDKCAKHRCPAYQECHLVNEEPECRCKTECEDYPQMKFCATNFHTYESMCELERYMCLHKTQGIKMAYPGTCKQYPYQSGIAQLEPVTGVAVAFCKHIELEESAFNKHAMYPVKVLLTVTWNNTQAEGKPHSATAAWSEDVSVNGFKACVMVAGRHFMDNKISYAPSVEWVAFQDGVAGSTDSIEVGTVKMKTWYTGSRCHSIMLNKRYSEKSKILVSVEHTTKKRSLQNAMTAWVERNSLRGDRHVCKICARELQNFDGIHEGVTIHYMAIHEEPRPYITEAQHIHFERRYFSSDKAVPPVCKTVKFNQDFPMLPNPTIIVTAVNTSDHLKNSVFSPHDIAVWVEGHNNTHLTACFKSLRAGMYREEVNLQYAIWPTLCGNDARFYNGRCYSRDGNDTLTRNDAVNTCSSLNSTLPKSDDINLAEAYFLKNELRDSDNKGVWMEEKNKDNECALFNLTSNENEYYACNHTGGRYPFVCQKDADLLKGGCHCMNGGSCVRAYDDDEKFVMDKQPECRCKPGFMGRRCEKPTKMKDCRNGAPSCTRGSILRLGSELVSSSGGVRFRMQRDGNLVIYCYSGRSVWATGTNNVAIKDGLMLQNDGNLVLYNYAGEVVWASNTEGEETDQLTVQHDANVVYYGKYRKAFWSTVTDGDCW